MFRAFRKRVRGKRQRTTLQYVLHLQQTWRECRKQKRMRTSKAGLLKALRDEEQKRPRLADVCAREFRAILEVFVEVTDHIDRKMKRRMVLYAEESGIREALLDQEDSMASILALRACQVGERVLRLAWERLEDNMFHVFLLLHEESRKQRLQRGVMEKTQKKELEGMWSRFAIGAAAIQDAYAERWVFSRKELSERERAVVKWEGWVYQQLLFRQLLDAQAPEYRGRVRILDKEQAASDMLHGEGVTNALFAILAIERRERYDLEKERLRGAEALLRISHQQLLRDMEEVARRNESKEEAAAMAIITGLLTQSLTQSIQATEREKRKKIVSRWWSLFKINGRRWRVSLVVTHEYCNRLGICREA
eukprot:Hpha_TRINITY_DN15322_c2_g6::TRINITY_DN15322_c2_g6_i4::g.91567::m.91567